MDEKDWKQVSDKIKKAKGDIFLFGELSADNQIHHVHYINPKKKKADDMTNSMAIFNAIENELRNSDVDFSLKNFNFDPETYKFDVEFLNETSGIDVFTNDTWKTGNKFIFNSLNFRHLPFFERLVCTNGMVKPQFGFKSSVSKASFNNEKLEKVIYNALHSINDTHHQLLEQYAKHLKSQNVSLYEFYDFREWLNKGSRKDSYRNLIAKYFDDEPFYKAFGMPVNEQTKLWKKSADSGINAYDFLNLLTWVASHANESGLVKSDADELKIHAANFFFKESLDLEEVAPKVKVDYPRIPEMN
jgi:hypothetical protein